MPERLVPQSLEAEQSTLGAMLMERDAIARAVEILGEEDFYRELHKKIFAVIVELFNAGEPADLVSVAVVLRNRNSLDDIGGMEYLNGLTDACPSAANVASYAAVVLEKSARRKIIAQADAIMGGAYDESRPIAEVKSNAEKAILSATSSKATGECFSAGEVARDVLSDLEYQIRNPGKLSGVSTGFPDLDSRTDGLAENQLWILAARPAMGKSALGLQIAYNVAKAGRPSLFFGFEMPRKQLVRRLACSLAGVDGKKVKRGWVTDDEIERLMDAVKEIEKVPLYIQDTSEMGTHDMRSRARRLRSELQSDLGLIVVDYLQIVADKTKGANENRTDALGRIARDCHIMGGESGCTTLALAQLNREVERREDKRPMLSDIRDSGSIEAEANGVAFIYRPGYYRRKELEKVGSDLYVEDDSAEVIIAKNRDGDIGTVSLKWTGSCTRFDSVALASHERMAPQPAPVWAPQGRWNQSAEVAAQ